MPRFSRSAWAFAFALALTPIFAALALSTMPAQAERVRPAPPPAAAPDVPTQETQIINCYEAWRLESCVITYRDGRISPHVIHVPPPVSEEARSAADARDRRWVARCRPAVQQDRYGMPRYVYAAPGCEFGVVE